MRLAARCKGGFYPVPPANVDATCRILNAEDGAIMLDPCCGEGAALKQFSDLLNLPERNCYGIELEEQRAEKTMELMPNAPIMGPASLFGSRITARSFGFIWCNPPFDDELGGGERTELTFLARATRLLASNGILALYVPEKLFTHAYTPVCRQLGSEYSKVRLYKLPEAPFGEMLCIARKDTKKHPYRYLEDTTPTLLEGCKDEWTIPETPRPVKFEKSGLTDAELLQAIGSSPLWQLTKPAKPREPARPPMPLAKGHLALLLASGHLDGVIAPEGEEPHLVRGTAVKKPLPPEETTEELASGKTKTTTVIKERIAPVVRVALPDGEIRTLE